MTAKAGSKAVAKAGTRALQVPGAYGEFAGLGYEGQTGADIAVPFLTVLQPLSPQVEEGTVEGAKPGIIFNTVTQELYEEPVVIIPVYTERLFVEWVPRTKGGGFVAIHLPDSDVVVAAREASEEFGKYKHGENDLVETFYVYCLVLDGPKAEKSEEFAVIAFKSTQIKVYKKLMTTLRTIKGNPPLFAHRVALTTRKDKNEKGVFWSWAAGPAVGKSPLTAMIPPTIGAGAKKAPHPLLIEGKDARDMVMSGLARADFASQTVAQPDKEDPETPF